MGLTDEQEVILSRTLDGHNLVITGQAGTGKSFLVTTILKKLKEVGKSVAVICSSGLACTVYEQNVASTVHSTYGLGTANLPWQKIVAKSKSNSSVLSRLRSFEVVIWDEVSMSSSRVLELVNAIEIAVCHGREYVCPFGGKQILVVGDFWQLKPVPNMFDDGSHVFTSEVFKLAFPHRYELTKLMRQNNDEVRFLEALSDVRVGQCRQETIDFISSLSRNLDECRSKVATHIFFLKLSAAIHNLNVMRSMPGQFVEFIADINGQTPAPCECPAEKVLRLKPGCKVMLLWNLSENLRNGTQGIFEGFEQNGSYALVKFPVDGIVKISRQTWSKVDRHGAVVGSMTQYPLIASYAITCHKSQGQTLPAAIVHCSNEFVSGLTYVALSRVKSADDLQVLKFNPRFLKRVPELVTSELWRTNDNRLTDFTCCKQKHLVHMRHTQATDRAALDDMNFPQQDDHYEVHTEEDAEYLSNIFESDNDFDINLSNINDILNEDEELGCLPDSIDVKGLLQSIINDDAPLGTNGHDKNLLIYEMLEDDCTMEKLMGFAKYTWQSLFEIMERHTEDNLDTIQKVSRQEFTSVTKNIHVFFNTKEYKACLYNLFNADPSSISPFQTSVACQFVLQLYSSFLKVLSEKVQCQHIQEINNVKVWDMPSEGKGKIRYVGGWALRKVMEKARSFIKRNIVSDNQAVLDKVSVCMEKVSLIQDELCVNIESITSSSKYPDTLELTESRQYRDRGLLHTTDSTFEFFMALEQRRIEVISFSRIKAHGSQMIEVALECLRKDKDLQEKWLLSFEDDLHLRELKECIYQEIIERIVNMGANQFLRDFRYQFKVKKTMELRKRVFQKKQKEKEKQDMATFQDILKDTSPGKVQSHGLLLKFIEDHKIEGLTRVYKKNELQLLCKAYRVKYNSKSNKKFLATKLVDVIKTVQQVPDVTPLQQ